MRHAMMAGLALAALAGLAADVTVSGKTGADIQKAIDRAAATGGGRVTVPAGEYAVASIRLRGKVDLHLEKGAWLKGSTKSGDYADFPDEICSIHPEKSKKVLVYAYDCDDIAITGEGVIDGQGPAFFDRSSTNAWHCWPKPPVQRPRMVQFVRCKGVRLQGVTFKDSPCWTMLIRLCEDITVDGITIDGEQRMINNDGIDFDGCRKVRVGNSKFKTCDDCIVLRAMREKGCPDRIVCEDIVVSNCTLNSWCQTVRLGCPSDDTIRNAHFKDIVATGNNGIFADFPARYLRADDEGYMDISDIVFENYTGELRGSALQIVSEKGVKIRNADGLVFRNFNVKSARPLRFIGNKGHEIKGVRLENFVAEVGGKGAPVEVAGCNGLVYANVTVNGKRQADGPVASAPGSDAPLKRQKSVSRESGAEKKAVEAPAPEKSVECRARKGLPNVLAKLKAGGTVRIAYLGGSITEANPGWRAMTLAWFRDRFPRARIEEINASISGTGSDYGACRLPGDVLAKKPDLLFVEFRVNGSAGYDYQSVEGIVRQTWAADPKTDICFVYTLCEWMLKDLADGKQTSFGAAMEKICDHYGIPSIDYGPEITKRLAAGTLLFKPTRNALKPEANQHPDAKKADENGVLVFSRDGCHPVKEGHEIYRDVVARSMAGRIFPASGAPAAHPLPAQLSKNAWLAAELVPSAEILKGEAWKPVDTATDPVYRASFGRTHRMLRGGMWTDREGTSVTLKWTGNTIGFSDIPQSRPEPMVLEVSVDGGKPYTLERRRTTEPVIYSRFWYLPEQPWGEHTATVTLKKLPAGQRWILGQFLVVGELAR